MNANELIQKARAEFAILSKLPINTVIGLAKKDDSWVISLEAVEKRSIPDGMDVLGIYEIRLDNEGNLLGFERTKLRKRSKTDDAD